MPQEPLLAPVTDTEVDTSDDVLMSFLTAEQLAQLLDEVAL